VNAINIDWLDGRVGDEEIVAKTANKYIGHCSQMIKVVTSTCDSVCRTSLLANVCRASRMNNGHRSRSTFVRNNILAEGALSGLNEEARRILLLMVDTGLRCLRPQTWTKTISTSTARFLKESFAVDRPLDEPRSGNAIGQAPLALSAILSGVRALLSDGPAQGSMPRAVEVSEIRGLIEQFRAAARCVQRRPDFTGSWSVARMAKT
jgi:hypothetical protein